MPEIRNLLLPAEAPPTNSFAQLRKAGAVVLSVAVGVFGVHLWDNHSASEQTNQALTAIGNLYGVQPDDITGDGLPTIPPDQHAPAVTAAERQELDDATVAVVQGERGDRFWEGDGTGTAVSYGGKKFVLTALHMLGANYFEPLKPRAADDLTRDPESYAVADPGLSTQQRSNDNVFGSVSGAAFLELANANGPDVALLKIKSLYLPPPLRQFKNITPIPMAKHLLAPPAPGEPVWMYGVPSPLTNPYPVGGYGTYLGRAMVPGPEDNIEKVDIVGLNIKSASQDACEHGHSGSDFIAPNGFVSGPAYYRMPASSEHVPFGELFYSTEEEEVTSRWEVQKALHANLSAYTVLCAFTVMDQAWPKELVKGFGVREDPYK